MASTNPSLLEQIKKYSTCDVSDALRKLGDPYGGFLPDITMWSPERQAGNTKIVGPAYTVQFLSVNDTSSTKLKQHYIDSIPKGSIVFISCPSDSINAAFGGLMSRRALASGVEGAVIDGRFRDLEEQRGLKMPIFARDVGIAPPYGEMKAVNINVAITYSRKDSRSVINPGDIIIADINGVAIIPQKLQDKIIPLMQSSVEADKHVAEDLEKGILFADSVKQHRV